MKGRICGKLFRGGRINYSTKQGIPEQEMTRKAVAGLEMAHLAKLPRLLNFRRSP
jgi:hypothetical protein